MHRVRSCRRNASARPTIRDGRRTTMSLRDREDVRKYIFIYTVQSRNTCLYHSATMDIYYLFIGSALNSAVYR